MYTFACKDSDNAEYGVKIISSNKYDSITNLIDGLNGVEFINMTAEDSTYKHYQWVTYTKTETELQVEELYDREQNTTLVISTITGFSVSII